MGLMGGCIIGELFIESRRGFYKKYKVVVYLINSKQMENVVLFVCWG